MKLACRLIRLLPQRLRDPIIRSLVVVDDDELAGVQVKVADTHAELEAAARLLHDAYVARGLIDPHPSGVRVTPHLVLPSTLVFVAKRGARVVGTLALVVDSFLGLPMEKVYPDEIASLRARGRKLAEVGALCVAPGERRKGISFLLNKLMEQCAELLEVDDLVICIHPDVEDIYRACLLFERIGPRKAYPGLADKALAVAMRLDLRFASWTYYQRFGHQPKTTSNPFYMYVERREPQMALPEDSRFHHRTAPERQRSARTLLQLRPDALDGLSLSQVAYVGLTLEESRAASTRRTVRTNPPPTWAPASACA